MKKEIIEEIKIPEGIEVEIQHEKVTVKSGDKINEKKFDIKKIDLKKEGDKIIIHSKNAGKNQLKMIGTIRAHLNNMLNGMENPFEYKLAIEFVHFPMTVDYNKEKREITIKNFLGEKKPRTCKIPENVEIEVGKNEVTVKSYNKETAGQVAANLEKVTIVKGKDRRKFQDGLYITEKAGKLI